MKYSTLLTHFSNVIHRFTTRNGGYSVAPYSSNNLAFHVGDTIKNVHANHELLAQQIGYKLDKLVHMKQVHSKKVIVVDNENFHNPPECDALLTNKVGVPLMVMSADCTPILLYDDVKKVIGVIHAGRAGAFENIVKETLKTMQNTFNVKREDVYVVLGASIQLCCYEVNEAIIKEAEEKNLGFATDNRDGKFYLDVNAILHHQLKESGVAAHHIEDLRACSSCQNEAYFSYRADNQITGRMAGIIMLEEY